MFIPYRLFFPSFKLSVCLMGVTCLWAEQGEVGVPMGSLSVVLPSGTPDSPTYKIISPSVKGKVVFRGQVKLASGDNVSFHRVIEGFMAQTGDVEYGNMENEYQPHRAGTGGSELPNLKAEFSGIPHDRGTLGAARSQNPDSANSQFFINFTDNHFLNRQYTVYGRVIDGMDLVDEIVRGEPPANPDRMVSVKVAADV